MNEIRSIRSFGRRRGRTLRPNRADALRRALPSLGLPAEAFDPAGLAPWARETWLEIGFGAGEHLVGQALAHLDVLIIGAEPFEAGMAAAAARIFALGLTNVRLFGGDARELTGRLPDASLDRLYLLFPDPWPKARHRKRRLLQPQFIAEAARLLKTGGALVFATDWADYAATALAALTEEPRLSWRARRAADWRAPPPDHIPTRYQMKALGDCAPIWLDFRRR